MPTSKKDLGSAGQEVLGNSGSQAKLPSGEQNLRFLSAQRGKSSAPLAEAAQSLSFVFSEVQRFFLSMALSLEADESVFHMLAPLALLLLLAQTSGQCLYNSCCVFPAAWPLS